MMKQEQQEKYKIENNYRYPGSRPFNDTVLDRSLFFGRDEEKQLLFHHILVENLFVLFSKSGMGKTSLLNAGLMQMLRDRDFLPMSIRFNAPEMSPLHTIYTGIEEAVQQRNEQVDDKNKIDYEPGELNSLWQFFKTTAFWIYDDVPLTPILILDQFEEFFTMHSQEEREAFITQLADLVRGRVPKTLRKTFRSGPYGYFPYSNTSPKVKIVISIREDYLGHLEEMSKTIPGILKNRFRLLPLKCHKAKDAIIKPAQLSGDEDEYKHIRSKGFSYADKTVKEMLDFLCERREMGKIIKTDEVEPFQLQLLCRHIEEKVRQKSGKRAGDNMVKPGDLGGKAGMKKVLQEFYEDRLKVLSTLWKRRKVRKLCEKGLIFNKRRSIMDEGRIIKKYKISKELLSLLVDNRLLRSERRVGSIFYELSHDTFIQPILESRRRRKIKQAWIGIPVLLIIVIIGIFYRNELMNLKREYIDMRNHLENALIFKHQKKYGEAIGEYFKILDLVKQRAPLYIEICKLYLEWEKPDDAIDIYCTAVAVSADYAYIYRDIVNAMKEKGMVVEIEKLFQIASKVDSKKPKYYEVLAYELTELKKYGGAIESYEKALRIASDNIILTYEKTGIQFMNQEKYDEAIKTFEKVIQRDPKNSFAFIQRGVAYRKLKKYDNAINSYEEALKIDSKNAKTYNKLGVAFGRKGDYEEAKKKYEKAIQIDPNYIQPRTNLAELELITGNFNKAFNIAREIMKKKRILTRHKVAMRFISIASLIFQDKRTEARDELNKFVEHHKSLTENYNRHWSYTPSKQFIKESSLEEDEKNLLLDLIEILESPEKAGDEEIKDLEITAEKVLKK